MSILSIAENWFNQRGWQSFPFQKEVWQAYLDEYSGLLNAPTGSGKTYALWIPCLLEFIQNNPNDYQEKRRNGLQVLWVTPLKALAKDIRMAMQGACDELEIPWQVAVRSGDTTQNERQKQMRQMPECLIITPESLHLLFTQNDYSHHLKNLRCLVVDEWHELLGTKRGVQVELAAARLRQLRPHMRIWGISATIGNLEQAKDILLGPNSSGPSQIIRAEVERQLVIHSILPDQVEKFPWSGHLGLKLMDKILPIIEKSKTTLIFTNTRAQTEIWYQTLLYRVPDLAGQMAMHHGSLDNEVRSWVEEALHQGILKLVVCTSSLDLGVDFRPVDTVIQVGSPKGISRFVQRAGRSGHQPGAVSTIYFLPTNSLELIESAAIQEAIRQKIFESRKPLEKCFDVLIQYLVTLAVGEGFEEKPMFEEIKSTFAFQQLTPEEWQWALSFITTGGSSLGQYDEFTKVIHENNLYRVTNRRTAMRHRLSVGTIVSDPVLKVKFISGGYIGTVEESFVARLNKGDNFWFAGRNLKLERIKDMTVLVSRARGKNGIIPRWSGGRMPLSTQLAAMIRYKLDQFIKGDYDDIELKTIAPLLHLQDEWSVLPDSHSLLIEKIRSGEGHHIFIYPFAGRMIHEILSALMAWRISQIHPISFSIAMNDYGFELLSDQEIPLEEALELDLFTTNNLMEDVLQSVNSTEMTKRKFREIAAIAGLIFHGYPGKNIGNKHLQASAQILYDVFTEYDPDNLLLQQALDEALYQQVEQSALHTVLESISQQKILIQYPSKPTPFSFPIMVDRLREKLSSETLEDRIFRMQMQLEEYAANGEF